MNRVPGRFPPGCSSLTLSDAMKRIGILALAIAFALPTVAQGLRVCGCGADFVIVAAAGWCCAQRRASKTPSSCCGTIRTATECGSGSCGGGTAGVCNSPCNACVVLDFNGLDVALQSARCAQDDAEKPVTVWGDGWVSEPMESTLGGALVTRVDDRSPPLYLQLSTLRI